MHSESHYEVRGTKSIQFQGVTDFMSFGPNIWYSAVPAITVISIGSDKNNLTLGFTGRLADRYSLSR